jgi:sugar phosphate isomerase/epimerase
MEKDLRGAMRIGIVHFMAYPDTMSGNGPILESIDELVADDFFDVIELTHIDDASVRKEAAFRIHVAGMDIAYACQPIILSGKLNLHSRDAEERRKAVNTILEKMEDAVEIRSVGIAVMSGPDPGETYREEESKLLAESLRKLCSRAHELNPDMDVVLETFDRAPFGKNCLMGPTREAAKLVEQIHRDYPRCGLMLDLSHLPLLEETPEHAVSEAAPVLLHAHVGNCVMKNSANPYYGDNHPPFGYQDGENTEVDLARYLRSLYDVGFLNSDDPPIVSIEVKPLNEQLRPATIGNVKRAMKRGIMKLNAME